MRSLWNDRSGAIAIYTAVVGTLMIGSAVLAIDYGRLTVLRSQMQNAADAAALAGAAQLDAQANAIARAIDVAQNAAQQTGGITGALTVANVIVLRQIDPSDAVATSDQNAAFVRVTMTPENANLLFQPVLDLLTNANSSGTAQLQATATARSNPILCPPPTILACTDSLDSIGQNISSPAYAGRQLALLQREAATVRRVVFRMLCPPNNPGCDNFEASQFSSSVDADQCSAGTVSVVQGGEGQADIDDGVNSRFGDDPDPSSSGNVVYYLRDPKIIAEEAEFPIAGSYGNGGWDIATYWTDRHGGALPGVLGGATRYQVYLYELGQTYARNGSQTIFPVPETTPAGFSIITPPGVSVPEAAADEDDEDEAIDGVPDDPATAVADPKRRVVTAAVANCEAQNFGAPIIIGSRFIELFITERSANSVIMGEVIGPLTTQSSSNISTNVQLVE